MAKTRYVKLLIDEGYGGNAGYNGLISVVELEIINKTSVNVALNKTITSASNYANNVANLSVDGNKTGIQNYGYATSETSGLTPNGSQWLLVDLGDVEYVNQINLYTNMKSGYSAVKRARIQFSLDGINFYTVYSFLNTQAEWTDLLPKIFTLPIIPVDNIVTSLVNIKPGDAIRCKYTAVSNAFGTFSELGTTTATEIPAASSATPDGSFYFIHTGFDYKGRMKLVADRNIQHSISWDTLNSAGLASGLPILLKFKDNAIPVMTSNTLPSGAASSSNNYSSTYAAFDSNEFSYWTTDYNTTTGWVAYEFVEPKTICKYRITPSTQTYITRNPKTWTFEGWNGSTWIVLDTQTNITNWVASTPKEFIINNKTPYIKYRINITANNGDLYNTSVNRLEMMEVNNSYNYLTRLLTGGTSATDLDNEWDKIIVSSNLGGTITAGDNNVWNWKITDTSACNTWISTVGNTSSQRVVRGGGNPVLITTWSSTSSTNVSAGVGFRPVLLVEQNVIRKYMILNNNNLVTYNSTTGLLETVGTSDQLTDNIMSISGFNDFLWWNTSFINQLADKNSMTLLTKEVMPN